MDRLVARRLGKDKEYAKRLAKIAKDYIKVGRDALAYWSSDFDSAYDALSCYASLGKKDQEMLERGHPKRFVLPMTATQITTMSTYVAQVLFGQDTPWKVEGRRPEDDLPAEFMNQLLRWNAEQQPTYLLGYLWVQDCIAINRGVFYNSWAPIFRPEVSAVPVPDPEDLDPVTQLPRTYMRPVRHNKVVGSYNRLEIVSPYDFVCDPSLPLWRLPEMRFCGHRTVIPITELRRRSKLSPDHPAYVLPSAVEELVEKAKKGNAQADAAVPSVPGVQPNPAETRMSRTAYERTRALQPTGQVQADKNDTGNAECWEIWIRMVPSEYKIYGEDDAAGSAALNGQVINTSGDPVVFQFLLGGGDVLLSLNESTYAHGQYPYAVGEGRPNAHFQFSPGWVTILKGIQDYVDWLKNRHQEALSRTLGNIFVYDPSRVDVTDFMNPDKEGLLISLKPEAYGTKLSDVFSQVPIKDLTENFLEEAMEFVKFSESVTAASAGMQGSIPNGADPSATQFAGTQQMGAGRMTSIARLLSSQALVPQAKQFCSNFQQYLDQAQTVRFKPSDPTNIPEELQSAAAITVTRDTIAGEYEFVAHDGTLPGTDGRKVAAIVKLLEAAQGFPDIFSAQPGNINPRKLLLVGAKASGLQIENFLYDASTAPAGPPGMPGLPPVAPAPGGPPGAPPMPGPARPPGPKPLMPTLPPLDVPELTSVRAPQPRPGNT